MMKEESQTEHFRQMALKCWQLAGSTDDPRAIDTLRKLAEEYEDAAKAGDTAQAVGAPRRAKPRAPGARG
ncbi:MAG: hypothetical protein ACJ8F4_09675 [Sphingomonas sp.]